jgi:AraC-like DNA-binding protein
MVKLEKITTTYPEFSSQKENKILYTNHSENVSIKYKSTYTLKFVLEGHKEYQLGNQNVKVLKNQYLILNDNESIQTEAKKGTKGLSFFLSPKLINEIYNYHSENDSQSIPLKFYECTQIKSNNGVGFWLDKMTNLLMKNTFILNHHIDDCFIKLSEEIVKEHLTINDNFRELNIIKYNTKKALYKFITQTKEYLNDNCSEKISLDTISQTIGVSKYYLHRVFNEINGCTPLEYITSIRLEKAKNKLLFSKKSISEIAIESGFDNISYFSTVFKNQIGCSPSQYRTK